MKILSIVGSPRIQGNTHILARKFAEGAIRDGAEVEEIFLGRLKVAPCIDCDKCNGDGICRIKDDFGMIVEKMRASEGYLFSTPVYCCSVTAQMKALFDRCNSLAYPNWVTGFEGKYAAFIIGAGYPPQKERDVLIKHNIRPDALLKLEKAMKISNPLREAIDPMVPFDPTIDTLRILYQFCAIMGIEIVGFMEVVGLGHDKESILSRSEELQKATDLGTRFSEILKNSISEFC